MPSLSPLSISTNNISTSNPPLWIVVPQHPVGEEVKLSIEAFKPKRYKCRAHGEGVDTISVMMHAATGELVSERRYCNRCYINMLDKALELVVEVKDEE